MLSHDSTWYHLAETKDDLMVDTVAQPETRTFYSHSDEWRGAAARFGQVVMSLP